MNVKNKYIAKGRLISAINCIIKSCGLEPADMEDIIYSVLCDLKDQMLIESAVTTDTATPNVPEEPADE